MNNTMDTMESDISMESNMSMGSNMSKKPETTFLFFDHCTPLDDVTPWCYTRTEVQLTVVSSM